jgi:hypothetical protein
MIELVKKLIVEQFRQYSDLKISKVEKQRN